MRIAPLEKGPLLLNYCVTGRCEIILNNGNFVYVKDGEISLTERFAQKQYVYPRRIYEGMEFFIDIDTLTAQSVHGYKGNLILDFHKVVDLFCPDGSYLHFSLLPPEVEEILTKLWEPI